MAKHSSVLANMTCFFTHYSSNIVLVFPTSRKRFIRVPIIKLLPLPDSI